MGGVCFVNEGVSWKEDLRQWDKTGFVLKDAYILLVRTYPYNERHERGWQAGKTLVLQHCPFKEMMVIAINSVTSQASLSPISNLSHISR